MRIIPIIEKFKGTLLGCACGDALGAPVEGMPVTVIREKYGKITDFMDSRFGAGKITDDTQMTVALAQSIIEFGRFERDHAAYKFAKWMENSDKGIKEARGAGLACATATRRLYQGGDPDSCGVFSAGCGAAMRTSPVGLRYFFDASQLRKATFLQAMITHTDPQAIAGSLAVAFAVACGINDLHTLDRTEFLSSVSSFIRGADEKMAEKISGVSDYVDSSPDEGFGYTGNGGYVFETVPAAIYAFIRTPYDFEETLVTAVNAGGDTDSIGAIAGAIAGAFNGIRAIPERWKEKVEGESYLEELAEKLFTLTPAYTFKMRTLI
ncbi:MAG: ADP-ribosylglycohydrolase family protein [Actinomycetota bacterium]|nr:ADP-ribosylglycohydrolase family protein [Actinomycetota bacterium]